jgi:hypothetical protein
MVAIRRAAWGTTDALIRAIRTVVASASVIGLFGFARTIHSVSAAYRANGAAPISKSVTLRIDNPDDENDDDDGELRQADSCEHRSPSGN